VTFCLRTTGIPTLPIPIPYLTLPTYLTYLQSYHALASTYSFFSSAWARARQLRAWDPSTLPTSLHLIIYRVPIPYLTLPTYLTYLQSYHALASTYSFFSSAWARARQLRAWDPSTLPTSLHLIIYRVPILCQLPPGPACTLRYLCLGPLDVPGCAGSSTALISCHCLPRTPGPRPLAAATNLI
jgi:hypothetical protein